MSRGRRFLAALTALVALVGVLACREPARQRERTILFAVDGLEWSVLLPLVAEGRLPTLAALMARGSYGRLATLRPTYSPVIWTTIATGRRPPEHGITDFERTGADGAPILFRSEDRRTKAFWNILSDHGRRVDVVGWWLTYPVEPISGVMVAQTNTTTQAELRRNVGIRKGELVEGRADQVHPPQREAEIFAIASDARARLPALLRETFGGAAETADPQVASLFEASAWALRADATYCDVARRLAREDAELLAVYFGGTDVVGHRFWRYHEPARYADPPSADAVRQFGNVITDYYVFIDRCMGEILAERDGEAVVLVVSDHGMEVSDPNKRFPPSARGAALISGNHLSGRAGVFLAAGPGIVQAEGPRATASVEQLPSVGSVLDVLPTLLALLGLPQGLDMPGQPMRAVLEPRVLASTPPPVSSHDTPEWQSERARLAERPPPAEDVERIRQLRELGYIR
jgi:arylsulfatase A-like enzyme